MRPAASILILALLAGCGGERPSPGPAGTGALSPCRPSRVLSVGMPIPSACRFRTLDGKVLALRELAGRPALINFWASWCTSCVEEMPALDRLHRSLAGRLGFLGVNLLGVEGETEETAREFERTTGVTYPSIFDERGLLFAHFSPARLMPSTVLVDKNGVIRYRSFGPRSFDELREAVERDLGIRS